MSGPAGRDHLADLAWPHHRLGEVVSELLRHGGLGSAGGEAEIPAVPATLAPEATGSWIERAAAHAGAETEEVALEYERLEEDLRRAAPAVLRLPAPGGDDEPPRYLALADRRRGQLEVLTPALGRVPLATESLCETLRAGPESTIAPAVDKLLAQAEVSGRRRRRTRRALFSRSLGRVPVAGCWLLRPRPGGPFLAQLARTGAGRRVAALVAAHTLQYGLLILSWYLIGRGALSGVIDRGWLAAWALLLATLVPISLAAVHLHGRLVIDLGILLKRRLLVGALKLPLDRVRSQGSGGLLGRVMESETFESLIASGGFQAVAAILEVVLIAPILWAGAGGAPHAALFAAWAALTLAAAGRFHHHLGRWTESRLDQTLELVERMVGFRTRVVQQAPERWHDGEDEGLASYHERSRPMDRAAVLLSAALPRAWMLAGTLAIAPAFLAGTATGPLAVAFGGNLLAFGALFKLGAGFAALATAHVAWQQIEPLYVAAAETGEVGDPSVLPGKAGSGDGDSQETGETELLTAENLTFRYPGGGAGPLLRGASLRLRRGERLLLEGPSGTGKSTLVSLLAGLRTPDAGLLLLHGLDRPTLGDEPWRGHLAAAPQFHENHVFLGTFAYNLLMGRRWPPTPEDLREAETLCRDLGLGDLLERMPGGLQQMVGETGWRLSHGEKSRLYLARALLQGAEVVILDESFAALDPVTLRRALSATFERAPCLLVVAHP